MKVIVTAVLLENSVQVYVIKSWVKQNKQIKQTQLHKNKSRPQIHPLLHHCEGSEFQFSRVETPSIRGQTDCLFVSETSIDQSIPVLGLVIPGYSPLIMKNEPRNRQSNEVGAYIKDGFPCRSNSHNKVPDLPFICFRVIFVNSTFFFTLYRPQDDGTAVFDKIVEKIDNVISECPLANIYIYG